MRADQPSVVVTGLGATTPLGGDVASTWESLLAGRSGARKLPADWTEVPLPVLWSVGALPARALIAPLGLGSLTRRANTKNKRRGRRETTLMDSCGDPLWAGYLLKH